MEEKSFPLPTPEEVLICNDSTTAEDVRMLLNHSWFLKLMVLIGTRR